MEIYLNPYHSGNSIFTPFYFHIKNREHETAFPEEDEEKENLKMQP